MNSTTPPAALLAELADDAPDVSLVIVSWNTRELLRACLRSVFANLGDVRAEVIVVDNASADGSADMVLEEFPAAVCIRNDANLGFAAANNVAFRRCRGRHVLLLNSDTELLGDVLARSLDWLDARPDVGAMGCRVLNPDRTLQTTCFGYPHLWDLLVLTAGLAEARWPRPLQRYRLNGWQRDHEREVDVITGCFLLVRRETIAQVGGLDETFFFCGEETDWCRRIRLAGWRVMFAPVGEIVHVGNASGRQLEARRDVLLTAGLVRLHRKHGGRLHMLAAAAILWAFNTSRWLGWSLLACLPGQAAAGRRSRHFRGVVQGFGDALRLATAPGTGAVRLP